MNFTNRTLQLGALLAAVAFGGVGAAAPLPQQNVFVSGEGGSHVIYSDDRGLTWMIGGAVRPQMNECQAVELSDGEGSLLLDMRNTAKANCRAQSFSHDAGQTWTAPTFPPELVEPRC